MFELVPSPFMRAYFESINFVLSDFQKAALIWNAPEKTWGEKLDALAELSDTTENEGLKKQIYERMEFEKRQFDAFKDNASGRFVYVVENSKDRSNCGFFADYERAFRYSSEYIKEYGVECSIKKQLIVKTSEDEIVRAHGRGNPYMGIKLAEFSKYDGESISGVYLNRNKEITRIWSYELFEGEEDLVSEYRPDRFEYPFIKIPFEMQIGTPVKNVVSGNYGILAQGKEEWDNYLKRLEERKLYVDYSDVQVVMYELTEHGYWSHQHVNPMYLDIEFPPNIPDDEEKQVLGRAMKSLSDYLYNKSRGRRISGKNVIKYAKEYSDLCRRKNPWNLVVENAKEPEDIMC